MKTAIIFLLLGISTAFAQVDCSERDQNFSGKCDTYNPVSGIRSSFNFKKGKKEGKFQEIYSSGQLRAEGGYKSDLLNGKFQSFYTTGEKMATAKFKSGSGSFIIYHPNGQKKITGEFVNAQPNGKWNYYNDRGDVERETDASRSRIDMYSLLVGDQKPQNGVMIDDFFQSFDNGSFSFSFGGENDSMFARMRAQMSESMKQLQTQMDELMRGLSDSSFTQSFHFDTTFTFNSFGDTSFFKSFNFATPFGEQPHRSNPYFGSSMNDLVDFPDSEPSYIGGEEAMNAFIQREIHGSENLEAVELEGTVFIEAIVEKDGSLGNLRVALGASTQLDQEALRIVGEMPLWTPAANNGVPVRSRCIIAVPFNQR